MWFLVAWAWADETGATVDCTGEDAACVTTGGLPGLCDADLQCVTAICYDDGDVCAIDGEWGSCGGEVCEADAGGCSTASGRGSSLLAVAASLLLAGRRRR
ncbi:MAG: hypothetical protein H6738_22885 [Alphaproteobacteria bacterium]|nr:hypothetical protein [Alphaproteobacteria bacterium]MCB9699649.1 hypothetical protein [Alphaproteobacteria bacterium]